MKKQTDLKKLEQRRKRVRSIGIRLLLLLLFFAMAYGANNRLEVSEYTYETDALSFSFDGFRIVQLSDLHNKVFLRENEQLLREVRRLQPDIIVMTGDMIDGGTHTDVPAAELLMKQAAEIAPCYYVYGNHEHLLTQEQLTPFLEHIAEYGIHYLDNENAKVESKTGQTLTVIGIDDLSLQANILQTRADEAGGDFKILLAHEPQLLHASYAPAGVDLVFSGHAHGGQFRIPFTGKGIWAPDQGFFPRMTQGSFKVKDTTMYISRGLGNSGFPLRLCNHPEIVSVTLRVVK